MFKIYVISMLDSIDDELLHSFEQHSLTPNLFPAVRGLNGAGNQGVLVNSDAILKTIGRNLTSPEVGCAASHLLLYQKLVKDADAECYLILEEDARITTAFVELLREILSLSACQYDVVSFFSGCAVVSNNQDLVVGSHSLRRVRGRCDHTVSYLISKQGAAKILDISGGMIAGVADWPVGPRSLMLYIASESFVQHRSSHSYLEQSRSLATVPLSKLLLSALLRAIKYWSPSPLILFARYHIVPALVRRMLLPGASVVSFHDAND